MSAKWRTLQQRHQYTYTAVIFPQSYMEKLNSLHLDIVSVRFFVELKELILLNSIYAQVTAVKKVASSFGELLNGGSGETVVNEAASFYLEIMFMENSLPLHRTLIGVLMKSRGFQSVIGSCLRVLCEEYGAMGKGRRFVLSRVALSLMSYPKLGFLLDDVDKDEGWGVIELAFRLKGVKVHLI